VGFLYFKWFVANIFVSNMTTFARILPLLVIALVFCGCATTTVQTRKQERAALYSELSPEFQSLVDQGRIKVGMPMDAVYIAWGKPSQVLEGESAQGKTTTWIYQGTAYEEYRYWGYGPFASRWDYWEPPYLQRDYIPRHYVEAEVVFENGLVKSWRSLPRPGR